MLARCVAYCISDPCQVSTRHGLGLQVANWALRLGFSAVVLIKSLSDRSRKI